MKSYLLAIITIITLTFMTLSCTNDQSAKELLENEGYKNIQMTGYKFFSCSKDDFFHTGFSAINANGKFVSGTVCEGFLFKGKTIRFD